MARLFERGATADESGAWRAPAGEKGRTGMRRPWDRRALLGVVVTALAIGLLAGAALRSADTPGQPTAGPWVPAANARHVSVPPAPAAAVGLSFGAADGAPYVPLAGLAEGAPDGGPSVWVVISTSQPRSTGR